jgi:hypothetical protein
MQAGTILVQDIEADSRSDPKASRVFGRAASSPRWRIAARTLVLHHGSMERDETSGLVAAIKEKIEQLHRDARARTRRWFLVGFDVRGGGQRSEADAAVAVPSDLREPVLSLTPETRALLRSWVLVTYDVRGARRARASLR